MFKKENRLEIFNIYIFTTRKSPTNILQEIVNNKKYFTKIPTNN